MKRAIAEGIVKREDICELDIVVTRFGHSRLFPFLIVITSKVWNTFHKHEHVKEAVKLQLKQWGLECGFNFWRAYSSILTAHMDIPNRFRLVPRAFPYRAEVC